MEHKPVFGLNLKHLVEEVATAGLLGKYQSRLEPSPLLVGVEFSLAERNHPRMHVCSGSERHEVAHIHRHHNLIPVEGLVKCVVPPGCSADKWV